MRKIVPIISFTGLLLAILVLGGALRVPGLADKPMHTDEAVQAVKFGYLLEDGYYRYDPAEYHGPTLYYFTLLPALLTGVTTFEQVGEGLLRGVPVCFGLGLILLLTLFKEGLGRPGILAAALLTAVSPIMVYFSRYYIQETLLVFFTLGALGCGWRFTLSFASSGDEGPSPSSCLPGNKLEGGRPRPPLNGSLGVSRFAWSLLTGLFLGLMHATKETAIISIACGATALGVLLIARRKRLPLRSLWIHGVAAACIALAVSAVFYSSMFTHARGPLDSVLAYFNFTARAGGQGHEKPWTYYLSILVRHREAGFRSSELFILLLAAVGGVTSFAARGTPTPRTWLGRFLALYGLLQFAVYSLIPYKTPWLMLGFVQGATLLAGVAVACLWDRSTHPIARVALTLCLLAGSADLARQAWTGSTRYGADDRNPYAYSHTSSDCLRLADRVRAISDLHPEGRSMTVKVMAEEYWPLPWYLRDLERVGYWTEVPEDPVAPVVITSPALAEQVEAELGEGYVPDLAGLRPGVFLVAYIRKGLWDRLIGGEEPSDEIALHTFAHYAMGTEFEITVASNDATYAGQAAQAAFAELDLIDGELSHYVQSSDISRLNRLEAGRTLAVGEHTWQCLADAREICETTVGAFDVAVGHLVNADDETRTPSVDFERTRMLNIEHLSRQRLRVHREDLQVDLGGIGKGYALDRMGETLAEWGLTNALLRASTSTVLGLGTRDPDAAGWTVTRTHNGDQEDVVLHNRAMSSSGREVQGDHIIDPRTGRPATHRTRVWVLAPDATRADALSTACMVMSDKDVRRWCGLFHHDTEVVVLDAGDGAVPRRLH